MKISEQARQKLIAKGYDPDFLQLGIDRWMNSGYGIDPNQAALRCYGTPTCQCFDCVNTEIEGYNLHGLPSQYVSVVAEVWDKVPVDG